MLSSVTVVGHFKSDSCSGPEVEVRSANLAARLKGLGVREPVLPCSQMEGSFKLAGLLAKHLQTRPEYWADLDRLVDELDDNEVVAQCENIFRRVQITERQFSRRGTVGHLLMVTDVGLVRPLAEKVVLGFGFYHSFANIQFGGGHAVMVSPQATQKVHLFQGAKKVVFTPTLAPA